MQTELRNEYGFTLNVKMEETGVHAQDEPEVTITLDFPGFPSGYNVKIVFPDGRTLWDASIESEPVPLEQRAPDIDPAYAVLTPRQARLIRSRRTFQSTHLLAYITAGGTYVLAIPSRWADDHRDLIVVLADDYVVPVRMDVNPDLVADVEKIFRARNGLDN